MFKSTKEAMQFLDGLKPYLNFGETPVLVSGNQQSEQADGLFLPRTDRNR